MAAVIDQKAYPVDEHTKIPAVAIGLNVEAPDAESRLWARDEEFRQWRRSGNQPRPSSDISLCEQGTG